MTPAARIQATIELLGEIEARQVPADRAAGGYFRKRRFIGSKDRRAISGLLFQVIRNRAKLGWWLEPKESADARSRVIVCLVLAQGVSLEDLGARFDGSRYGPALLDQEERDRAARLVGQSLVHADQPAAVRGEVPAWLHERLAASLGADCGRELEALSREAPIDLRANPLKTEREALRARLAEEGVESEPTARSPLGLRLVGRRALPALAAFKEGWFEVQDEGSQLVALLADARPGMAVADFCAGAGGKALALGAAMAGEGRLAALDIAASRLARAGPRLKRAGLEGVESIHLAGPADPWLAENQETFDRVLIDAPCTGSGAWRRSPDARWRLTPDLLDGYRAAQSEALDTGAGLVKPGGRLIYATCSFLQEENAAQVRAFCDSHAGFRPVAVPEVWASCLESPCPTDGLTLQLTPARHDTDGFFVAIFERVAA